jgi:hypothetical protein
MLPPDLHRPFASTKDRSRAAQQLLDQQQLIEDLQRLAALPLDQWPPEQTGRLPPSLSGDREHVAERLARWCALFADELRQVGEARNAVAHGHLSDVELRTAVYLAGRLLDSIWPQRP